MVKRFVDIVFSFILLLSCSWLFLIVALILKTKYPDEPIFFIQDRVGLKGEVFRIYKFRSMTSKPNLQSGFDIGSNSRVTGFGAILRKTKIDELPQFYNVLRGDMSIVGPRPEVEEWTNVYRGQWRQVLSVRPGITDNASLVFRNEEEILRKSADPKECYLKLILPKKLEISVDYAQNHNLLKDLQIILKTIYVVAFR